MVHKAAILIVGIAALLLVARTPAVQASQPFNPTFDITWVSPITPSANGDISQRITVPAGDHLPAIEHLSVPPGWDIAAAGDVPYDDKVGEGAILTVDQYCDGSLQGFAFNIVNSPTEQGSGDKAHWTAYVFGGLAFDFVVNGSAATGHTIKALLFFNPTPGGQGLYCAPMDLSILHNGVSSPGNAPVLFNPSVEGVYTWSSQLQSAPLPAEHITDPPLSDTVAIGADADGDLVPDFQDNCDNVPNGPLQEGQLFVGNQTDLDVDSLGDACDPDDDNDTFCDPGQSSPSCTGSDFGQTEFYPAGHDHSPLPLDCRQISEDVGGDAFHDSDGCPEPDNDNDGVSDYNDQCPGNDSQAGPDGALGVGADFNHSGIQDAGEVWPIPPTDDLVFTFEDYDGVLDGDGCPGDDEDGDGWTDNAEATFLGTNPALCCSQTGAANDEDPDPGPPDFNDNQVVGIDDIFFVASRFNATGGGSYTPRAELASQNDVIGIDDIFAVTSRFNQPS